MNMFLIRLAFVSSPYENENKYIVMKAGGGVVAVCIEVSRAADLPAGVCVSVSPIFNISKQMK